MKKSPKLLKNYTFKKSLSLSKKLIHCPATKEKGVETLGIKLSLNK
tara:strand:+ start:1012 stop:1149 length:138 start_codon:yes stop_codon:yes gene_type:complete